MYSILFEQVRYLHSSLSCGHPATVNHLCDNGFIHLKIIDGNIFFLQLQLAGLATRAPGG